MNGEGLEQTQPTHRKVAGILVRQNSRESICLIEKKNINTNNALWILLDLIYYYEPVCSTVYALCAAYALQKHMIVKAALPGSVVSLFFDGLLVTAIPTRQSQSTAVTGTNKGRLYASRTRHRKSPNSC